MAMASDIGYDDAPGTGHPAEPVGPDRVVEPPADMARMRLRPPGSPGRRSNAWRRPDDLAVSGAGGRILQISKFYPPVMGGIETVAWELTEALNRLGLRTDVLCSHHLPKTSIEHPASGYRVIRASTWGRLLSTSVAPQMMKLLWEIEDEYDLIHLHMPDPMAALAVWAVRPDRKLVVHWHSDVIRQRIAMRAYGPLQNWILDRADRIVTTSAEYAQSSRALAAWRHKVTVVPIGISDNRGEVCGEKEKAIRARFGGRKLVFALGRMTYYKGFEVLVEAAAALPDEVAVMIGGDGELLEQVRDAIVRRGLEDKVHLLGHIRDDELASHFAACDVFCMSSTVRAEAYGVATVEAMVMGKPIVATDIVGSGVPWVNVHGQTGLNVPVGDAPALAGALNRLLGDELLRHRCGKASRARYEAEFRADRMALRTAELYESLGVHSALRDDIVPPTTVAAHPARRNESRVVEPL